MLVMEFAIAEKKSGFCINARSPYIWTDCGKITVQNDASEATAEFRNLLTSPKFFAISKMSIGRMRLPARFLMCSSALPSSPSS